MCPPGDDVRVIAFSCGTDAPTDAPTDSPMDAPTTSSVKPNVGIMRLVHDMKNETCVFS